jgi:hypothetical protein
MVGFSGNVHIGLQGVYLTAFRSASSTEAHPGGRLKGFRGGSQKIADKLIKL